MAAATIAICSVVACTRPWPMADAPTARSSPISAGDGIVVVAAPGIGDVLLNPKRSATDTSRRAPSLAPSGAKTELHETAKAWSSVPPQTSPLAFFSATPERIASLANGYVLDSDATPSCSAPVAVIILNVDPGGWRPENAMPEAPRTSPVCGF